MIFELIAFVAILTILILAHELGHFCVARFFGVDVEEFGIGFPPRLGGIRKGGTLYSLNWVPLGGFVRIKGEAGGPAGDPHGFSSQTAWKRAVILLAGVSMNVVLAVALLFGGLMVGLPSVVDSSTNMSNVKNYEIQVAGLLPDSPAVHAGVQAGDVVVAVNGVKAATPDMISTVIEKSGGEPVTIEVVRNHTEHHMFSLQATQYQGTYVIGVELLPIGLVHYGPAQAFVRSISGTWYFVEETGKALWRIMSGLFVQRTLSNDVGGPIAIAVLTARAVNLGIGYVLQFAALLSLNLALINVLPFPALDGGRVLFLIIEKVRRKPVPERIEAWIHNAGFALLMIFVVAITYRDASRFGSSISHFFKNFF